MATTVEIPDDLARAVQRRAAADGRDVAAEVVELVRKGLGGAGGDEAPLAQPDRPAPLVPKHLPLIKARPAMPAADARSMSPQEYCDWLKELDLQLDVEHYEKALGHQHVDRADG